jgi:hypothetical protein
MDQATALLALIAAAAVGIVATLGIMRRQRHEDETQARATDQDLPFAVSTEGMKRCPVCGTGNLVTDATCSSCGYRLPG